MTTHNIASNRVTWCSVRFLPIVAMAFAAHLAASEATPTYPLWDGVESVAVYANRLKLPQTKTLELGDNVKMELVLIPAGKFIMGTPPLIPVDEAGFSAKIARGQFGLAASGGALLTLSGFVLLQALRKRRRPQLSLGLLLLVTVASGGCVLSGLHWRQSVNRLQAARLEYNAAEARFKSADESEKPAHTVMLTQPFYMGKFDVTQKQYQAVIGSNPSNFKGKDNPVEQVSWNEAQTFCEKLTKQTNQTVRLPTEAEWEYCCRGGTFTEYSSGDCESDLGRVAWYYGNGNNTTHAVGQKEPNAFGLYDMHGNVWQWCQDWYDENYYSKSIVENPSGPTQGTFRLLRGGSWYLGPVRCSSAHRGMDDPVNHIYYVGFRIVLSPE